MARAAPVSRRSFLVLAATPMVAVGCGGAEAPPPPDCNVAATAARDLAGVGLSRPTGTPAFALQPVAGRAARGDVSGGGRPVRLQLGETVLRGGLGLGRLLDGAGAPSLTPLDGLAPAPRATAWRTRYSADGTAFEARLVAGRPAAASAIPTAGQLRLTGPASVSFLQPGAGDPERVLATAEIVVGLGSRQAAVQLTGLPAAAGLARIEWRGLALCGRRIVSTGQGRPRQLAADGTETPVTGPPPAAVFDATLFAAAGAGATDTLGGAFIVQGDAASLAGVFLARAA